MMSPTGTLRHFAAMRWLVAYWGHYSHMAGPGAGVVPVANDRFCDINPHLMLQQRSRISP